MAYAPDRGDVIWIDFDPQAGHEQAGKRPAVVLSPVAYNGKVGLALMCPVTNNVKGFAFEVKIPDGLAVNGVVMCDQVRSFDWQARNATFKCKLPGDVLEKVMERARTLLD